MNRRLLKKPTVRYFFQFLLLWGLVIGPHGSLEALALLDGDCSTSCPCDSEQDEQASQQAEPCSDACKDCNCKASFMVALVPSLLTTKPARIAAERESTSALLPAVGELHDIFLPPKS